MNTKLWVPAAMISCSLMGMFVGMIGSHFINGATRGIQNKVDKTSTHNKEVLDRIEAQLYENINRLKRNERAIDNIEKNSKRLDILEAKGK